MTVIILGTITAAALLLSFMRSKKRTGKVFKKAGSMASAMVVQLSGVLLIIALVLAVLDEGIIASVLGTDNTAFNSFMGAIIGAVTIIPGIIAFPLGDKLLQAGAGYLAVAAFITTLTMVGIATSPVEIKHFGRKFTLYRNGISFVFALAIAAIMGVFL
jgi:uncharacterized membrane protein YraQ (UPF0718 family)